LGRGSSEAIAEVRLFPIWRRAAAVYRECFCPDGSVVDSGDDCTEIPAAAGGEPSGGTTRLHYAATAAWSARYIRAPPCKRRSEKHDGRAVGCRGLAPTLSGAKDKTRKRATSETDPLAPRGHRPQLCAVLHDT